MTTDQPEPSSDTGTDPRISGARDRLHAATNGPWSWYQIGKTLEGWSSGENPYSTEVIDVYHYGECGCRSACELVAEVSGADADFIEHAPTMVADLLAVIEEQAAEIARLRRDAR